MAKKPIHRQRGGARGRGSHNGRQSRKMVFNQQSNPDETRAESAIDDDALTEAGDNTSEEEEEGRELSTQPISWTHSARYRYPDSRPCSHVGS